MGTDEDNRRWEAMWRPRYPLATDDLLEGLYRMSRPKALDRRYVEANPQAISNLLIVDCDQPDAVMRAMWNRKDWLPNVIVENPANGHAHAVWALETAIPRTEYAHRKPLAYAAAVTEGLRRSVDGDQAYSGLITKNPESAAWQSYGIHDHLYELAELDAHLDDLEFMPAPGWRRTRRRNPVGLGRNCAMFETARTWAYRQIRFHWGDPDGLAQDITGQAHQLNTEYAEPLPVHEVDGIAASIHRWITTRSRMWADGPAVYEATFSTIQSARRKKAQRRSAALIREALG